MLALSIRQPFAELILRGIKRVEYRTKPTRIIGQRFYLYASKGAGHLPLVTGHLSKRKPIWSSDLSASGEMPEWMIELAEQIKMIEPDFDKLSRAVAMLPRGVIVGSAMIESVSGPLSVVSGENQKQRTTDHGQLTNVYQWHLTNVERIKRLRKPKNHPQPVWFRPF